MTTARHSYLQEALSEPLHALTLPAALLLGAWAVFSGRYGLFALGAALEGGFLLLYPLMPGFRRKCEAAWARDDAQAGRDRLQASAAHLSENAKARLRSLERHRETVLTQLRAWPDGESAAGRWSARLDELVAAGLRILLALDAAPQATAAAFDDSEIKRLEQEVARAHDGPAKTAKQQRLEHLKARTGRGPNLAEQQEAARVQLDTLEDMLEDLERATLEGRDAAAFGARLEQTAALVESARQSVAALEAQAPGQAELAEAKRLTS
ncbi:MAG: hypothetical protein JST54_18180 [Deltaproteobacteria bacterium]|nr:hypothetical protein [Deltaproteobacteria bacterium]